VEGWRDLRGDDQRMTYLEHRQIFARLLVELLAEAHRRGYEVAVDEVKRGCAQAAINAIPRSARTMLALVVRTYSLALSEALSDPNGPVGIAASLHRDGLAVDLQLYRPADTWLTKADDYRPLAEWWEQRHPLARWGGRFGDADHFSIEYQGRK